MQPGMKNGTEDTVLFTDFNLDGRVLAALTDVGYVSVMTITAATTSITACVRRSPGIGAYR